MPCDEITKAIEWSNKSNSKEFFPVQAYLTLHNGLQNKEPIGFVTDDQVWYATGGVKAVANPTPHLAGTLTDVSTNGSDGVMSSKPSLDVKVQVFPDGTVSFQRLVNGAPIGGGAPTTLAATCVDNDLVTGISAGQVITIGVARAPSQLTPS